MSETKKSTIIKAAFARMAVPAKVLYLRGISLRLLSSFICANNFASAYYFLLLHDARMPRLNKSRPRLTEVARLAEWKIACPAEAKAMEERGITARQWCSYYGLTTGTDNGYADFDLLSNQAAIISYTGLSVKDQLHEDFPSLCGSNRIYWARDIDPDLYYWLDKYHPGGKPMYLFSINSLDIKVFSRSQSVGFYTFSRCLQTEVSTCRLEILAKLEVIDDESISRALNWLPEEVCDARAFSREHNTGLGHEEMRKRAAEAAGNTVKPWEK